MKKSNIEKEFFKLYTEEIEPCLYELEKERKLKIFFILSAIAAGVLLTGFFIILSTQLAEFSSFAIALTALSVIWFIHGQIAAYAGEIKERCGQKIASLLNCEYEKDVIKVSFEKEKLYKSSGLFASFNQSIYNDIFSGLHKNLEFCACEADFGYTLERNKVTVFRGIILNIKLNNFFEDKTVIIDENAKNLKANNGPLPVFAVITLIIVMLFFIIGNANPLIFFPLAIILSGVIYFSYLLFLKKAQKTITFDSRYEISSKTNGKNEKLLSAKMLNNIDYLKSAFDAYEIRYAAFENNFIVAISTRQNCFEAGNICTPATKEENFNALFEQFFAIVDFVDFISEEFEPNSK